MLSGWLQKKRLDTVIIVIKLIAIEINAISMTKTTGVKDSSLGAEWNAVVVDPFLCNNKRCMSTMTNMTNGSRK